MKCPRCQHENPVDQKFCGECGTPLKVGTPAPASYADLRTEVENLRHALGETQEQQKATSEILRVISSSPTDTQPVFDAIAESATRLLKGWSTTVLRLNNESLYVAATYGGLPGSADT